MIYSGHVSGIYRGKRRNEVPPHIFAIAEGSYGSMCLSKFSHLQIKYDENDKNVKNVKLVMMIILHFLLNFDL